MLRTRVIPILLLSDESLIKTVRFGRFSYVGDPCNTARIFNELEVDELIFLDISAARKGSRPNMALLKDIADECFMPLAYGGGVRSLSEAEQIYSIGFEKVVLNSAAVRNPGLIEEIAKRFGSQAVVISIDYKKNIFGGCSVWIDGGRQSTKLDPVIWAQKAVAHGAGEILLTSIDREGTWTGFDLEMIRTVADAVTVPVVAHGGCGRLEDIASVVNSFGASAVGIGSLVVYQKKGAGVLVNFPSPSRLRNLLA
ncbi:imidazole glycerol phosphate synthase subunit HisF [Rhodocyclus tenuis]|uniref:imidazole glycerol-phosphate synthase n=1 Tax=Rhodocyclus gracilis TaxID=2929842 RepID=A0ABX0WIQ6_9RHOO|nr:AglZ/HisF2 family acetamidino modification protein [Rhodocyclus gracilis]MRD72305.1 imidazole glycerol phosphate synthase subunit HisF [Rhodocyclus gracilis]NJA89606.1 imidazole glycerol phosphate synthase subunit HisF [Rhodocyclus gracilis]